MKNPFWLLQTEVLKEDLITNLQAQFALNSLESKVITSPSELHTIDSSSLVIPYGSVQLAREFANSSFDKSGFFFNEVTFTTKAWVEHLGIELLNFDAKFCSLKEALELDLPSRFFIKPDSDLKSFTGSTVGVEGLTRFVSRVEAKEFSFDSSIPVVVAPLKNTGWEWRIFMIKSEVIGASSYKLKSMLNLSKGVPDSVINYAKDISKIWQPDEAYVIDIGESDKGLKVVEYNCINCSGMYNCSVESFVSNLTKFVSTRA